MAAPARPRYNPILHDEARDGRPPRPRGVQGSVRAVRGLRGPAQPEGGAVSAARRVARLPGRAAVVAARLYQRTISPLLPRALCRFEPTCSQYFIEAVERH